jgi:hypothetical protein
MEWLCGPGGNGRIGPKEQSDGFYQSSIGFLDILSNLRNLRGQEWGSPIKGWADILTKSIFRMLQSMKLSK